MRVSHGKIHAGSRGTDKGRAIGIRNRKERKSKFSMKKLQALVVMGALALGTATFSAPAFGAASDDKKHAEKKDHKEKPDDHKKKKEKH